jgi:hypothetical protein
MFNLESKGRRHYIKGNTFAHKDVLKSMGFKWDGDEKAWWTGKKDDAEAALAKLQGNGASNTQAPAQEGLADKDKIRGKVSYQNKTYLLLWSGHTAKGLGYRIASMDGSKVFWAKNPQEVRVIKYYETFISFGKLKSLRDSYSQSDKNSRMESDMVGTRGQWQTTTNLGKTDTRPKASEVSKYPLGHVRDFKGQPRILVGMETIWCDYTGEDAEDMGHYGEWSYRGWVIYKYWNDFVAEDQTESDSQQVSP